MKYISNNADLETFVFSRSLVKLTFLAWTFTTTMLTFDKKRQDQQNLTNFDKTKTDTESDLYERRRIKREPNLITEREDLIAAARQAKDTGCCQQHERQ